MLLRLRNLTHRLRASLLWSPLLMVVTAALLAPLVRWLSTTYADAFDRIPFLLSVSRDTATRVLEVVATSIITVAGLVFSVMVVAVQLASSQFSPRVLRRFVRDRFTQATIGLLVGTFTFSLVLLSAPIAGDVPRRDLATTVALLLALASVVVLMAFIDHTAKTMQVGNTIREITAETRELIARVYPHRLGERPPRPVEDHTPPTEPGHVVRSRQDGWIQHIDLPSLLGCLPDEAALRVDLPVGKFAVEGMPLCTVWPAPDDPDRFDACALHGYTFGSERAMRQDVAFGIRQLVDIALRALSPGINDPATAYEVISNLGAIFGDLLRREMSAKVVIGDDGRRLYQPQTRDHGDYLELAFDQVRVAAAPHAAVIVSMLNLFARLQELLTVDGLPSQQELLRDQAALAVEALRLAEHTPDELRRAENAAHALGIGVDRDEQAANDTPEQEDW